jgi:hypothetical protein
MCCNEIDYISQTNSVCHVTDYAREEKSTRAKHTIVSSGRSPEIKKHRDRCGCCESYKEPPAEGTTFLQLTESDSGIFGVNEIEQTGDNGAILTKPEFTHRPRLARLISKVDSE